MMSEIGINEKFTLDPQNRYEVITNHHLECEMHLIATAANGRETPFYSGYSPQFHWCKNDSSDWSCSVYVKGNIAFPGEQYRAKIELNGNAVLYMSRIGLSIGHQFAIREGYRIIAVCKVTKVADEILRSKES